MPPPLTYSNLFIFGTPPSRLQPPALLPTWRHRPQPCPNPFGGPFPSPHPTDLFKLGSFGTPPPQSLLLAQDLLKLVHYIAHTYEDKRVLGLRQKGLLVSEFSGSKIIRLCMYLHEFINVAKGLNIFPRFCQK